MSAGTNERKPEATAQPSAEQLRNKLLSIAQKLHDYIGAEGSIGLPPDDLRKLSDAYWHEFTEAIDEGEEMARSYRGAGSADERLEAAYKRIDEDAMSRYKLIKENLELKRAAAEAPRWRKALEEIRDYSKRNVVFGVTQRMAEEALAPAPPAEGEK